MKSPFDRTGFFIVKIKVDQVCHFDQREKSIIIGFLSSLRSVRNDTVI